MRESIPATAAYVAGSVAATPKSSLLMVRASAHADAMPSTRPAAESRTPRSTTIPTTRDALAPSAIRRPISRLRCVTVYASRP